MTNDWPIIYRGLLFIFCDRHLLFENHTSIASKQNVRSIFK